MKFQRFTCLNVSEKHLRRAYLTHNSESRHWENVTSNPDRKVSKFVEEIFEDVRLKEFPELPSRRNCLFLFDSRLSSTHYANIMGIVPHQFKLVEVELLNSVPNVLRVNKSFLSRMINDETLRAGETELRADARKYWSGTEELNFDQEVLFTGRYQYTRIISEPAPHCCSSLVDFDDKEAGASHVLEQDQLARYCAI